jgi:glycosyltransferase involved in cell wall biosynthesis
VRVLFVARNRHRLPLSPTQRLKWDALGAQLELRVLGSAAAGSQGTDPRFRLLEPAPLLDGPLFWLRLPFVLRRELRAFRPDAVVAQSPYEAAVALAVRAPRVVVEIHGDWRTATRLYGSPARALLNRLADRVAAWAIRRSARVRTITPFTSGLVRELGVEPAAEFPAFMDLAPFLGPPAPLPPEPVALFVGVLERYKNADGLAEAWRLAAPRLPGAQLRIVGKGTLEPLVERLVADFPAQTSWQRELPTDEVAAALDEARLLVLPSRSEGMGRIVVEALARGRPVLAAKVGGIPDLVRDGENGVLVEPEPVAVADALVALLTDSAQLERLAANARGSAEPWLATPEEYANRVRRLLA